MSKQFDESKIDVNDTHDASNPANIVPAIEGHPTACAGRAGRELTSTLTDCAATVSERPLVIEPPLATASMGTSFASGVEQDSVEPVNEGPRGAAIKTVGEILLIGGSSTTTTFATTASVEPLRREPNDGPASSTGLTNTQPSVGSHAESTSSEVLTATVAASGVGEISAGQSSTVGENANALTSSVPIRASTVGASLLQASTALAANVQMASECASTAGTASAEATRIRTTRPRASGAESAASIAGTSRVGASRINAVNSPTASVCRGSSSRECIICARSNARQANARRQSQPLASTASASSTARVSSQPIACPARSSGRINRLEHVNTTTVRRTPHETVLRGRSNTIQQTNTIQTSRPSGARESNRSSPCTVTVTGEPLRLRIRPLNACVVLPETPNARPERTTTTAVSASRRGALLTEELQSMTSTGAAIRMRRRDRTRRQQIASDEPARPANPTPSASRFPPSTSRTLTTRTSAGEPSTSETLSTSPTFVNRFRNSTVTVCELENKIRITVHPRYNGETLPRIVVQAAETNSASTTQSRHVSRSSSAQQISSGQQRRSENSSTLSAIMNLRNRLGMPPLTGNVSTTEMESILQRISDAHENVESEFRSFQRSTTDRSRRNRLAEHVSVTNRAAVEPSASCSNAANRVNTRQAKPSASVFRNANTITIQSPAESLGVNNQASNESSPNRGNMTDQLNTQIAEPVAGNTNTIRTHSSGQPFGVANHAAAVQSSSHFIMANQVNTEIAEPLAELVGNVIPVRTQSSAGSFGTAHQAAAATSAGHFNRANQVNTQRPQPCAGFFGNANPITTQSLAGPFAVRNQATTEPYARRNAANQVNAQRPQPFAGFIGNSNPVTTQPLAGPFAVRNQATAAPSESRYNVNNQLNNQQAEPFFGFLGNDNPVAAQSSAGFCDIAGIANQATTLPTMGLFAIGNQPTALPTAGFFGVSNQQTAQQHLALLPPLFVIVNPWSQQAQSTAGVSSFFNQAATTQPAPYLGRLDVSQERTIPQAQSATGLLIGASPLIAGGVNPAASSQIQHPVGICCAANQEPLQIGDRLRVNHCTQNNADSNAERVVESSGFNINNPRASTAGTVTHAIPRMSTLCARLVSGQNTAGIDNQRPSVSSSEGEDVLHDDLQNHPHFRRSLLALSDNLRATTSALEQRVLRFQRMRRAQHRQLMSQLMFNENLGRNG